MDNALFMQECKSNENLSHDNRSFHFEQFPILKLDI
jgi:hypothetical protein